MNRRLSSLLVAIIAVSASIVSAQSIWKEPKHQSWKTATGAGQYEQLLWQSVKDKDWLAVESHLASNFVYQDSSGTKDKAQHIADLKLMTVSDTNIGEPNVVPSGNHAIVTYVIGNAHYMSVWQEQKSGWVQVAMSVSK